MSKTPLILNPHAIIGLWIVYERPADYPHGYVARQFNLGIASKEALTAETLNDIRGRIWLRTPKEQLRRSPRRTADAPAIIEFWY